MQKRIVVHVGPPKTGSTFLQSALNLNTEALLQTGFQNIGTQASLRDAASELIGSSDRASGSVPVGAWDALRNEIDTAPGDVVLSCERFSLLRTPHIRIFADAFPDADIVAVLTLRDSAALLPSRWQEGVKNGRTESWTEYCAQLVEDKNFLARMTRSVRAIESWNEGLGPERVAVVTLPPPGSQETLLSRFSSATGIPLEALTARVPERQNESIGLEGAELLVRVNQRHTLPWPVRKHELKGFLTSELAGRKGLTSPVLSPAAYDVARQDSHDIVNLLRAAGNPVSGDLEDLLIVKPPPADIVMELVPPESLDAAADAIAALAQRSHAARIQAARLERLERIIVPAERGQAWRRRVTRRLGFGKR